MSASGRLPRASGLSPERVAAFLRDNPDFFEVHADLLLDLSLPHDGGAGAVSLVERQIKLLRRRNAEMRRTLEEYVANARASDELAGKLNLLVTRLLACREPGERLRGLPENLREIFSLDFVRILLFGAAPGDCAEVAGIEATPRENLMAEGLSAVLKANAPRCGRYSSEQRQFLFGEQAGEVASVALAPLGDGGKLGLLALGSSDPDHYHRGKSTDFLGRVSEIVAMAVSPENA